MFNKAVITAKGLALDAKIVAGQADAVFTAIRFGNGTYSGTEDLNAATAMKSVKQTFGISSISITDGNTVRLRSVINNVGIEEGYYISEVGIYAQDPDVGEILYSIAIGVKNKMDYQPSESELEGATSTFDTYTVVSNTESATIKMGTGAMASAEDVEELQNGKVDIYGGDISETVVETLEPTETETKFPIPSAGESIKRFLGKVRRFLKNIKPLETDVVVYVATTGSDTTGSGSETAPYRTITYALSKIPKDLGGYTATIHVADGTYNESINIVGYYGGYIILKRNGSQELNSACNISSIRVEYCNSVSISGFNLTNTEGTSIFTSMCEFINIAYCQSIVATEINEVSFNFDYVAVGRIVGCRSLNHYTCLRSYSSNVTSHNWSDDSQGSIGIFSDGGGRVARGNVFQPKGTISDEVHPGGGINVNHFGASIGTLPYNTTLYVSPTGSDETGNGTQEKPFRTIQKALNILPKDFGRYSATIIIANGTYDEHVEIIGYSGSIYLQGPTRVSELNDNIKIRSIACYRCTNGYVVLNGLTLTGTNDAVLNAFSNSNVIAEYLKVETSSQSTSGIGFYECAFVYVKGCRVSNKGIGIFCSNSNVFISPQTTGANNITGVYSNEASSVHVSFTAVNMGTTRFKSINGGAFINGDNGTQISGIISSGLSCTWGTISGGFIRNGIAGGTGMITVQLRVVVTTSLSANVEYAISGFPGYNYSSGSNLVAVATNPSSQTVGCHITYNGSLIYRPSTTIASGTAIIFNTTYLATS
jgi:pectin methylesterase-like acyl-CoA thioesterase